MSIEGVRVVLVHEADQAPEDWINILIELCSGTEPQLLSCDQADTAALKKLNPHRIVTVADLSGNVIRDIIDSTPVLAAGAALPSLMQAFGGDCEEIYLNRRPKENYLMHDAVGLWTGFTEPYEVKGYPTHAPDQSTLPPDLVVTAWNDETVALAVRHRTRPLVGWNFHPNDLEGQVGRELLLAFLEGKYLMDTPTGPPEI